MTSSHLERQSRAYCNPIRPLEVVRCRIGQASFPAGRWLSSSDDLCSQIDKQFEITFLRTYVHVLVLNEADMADLASNDTFYCEAIVAKQGSQQRAASESVNEDMMAACQTMGSGPTARSDSAIRSLADR